VNYTFAILLEKISIYARRNGQDLEKYDYDKIIIRIIIYRGCCNFSRAQLELENVLLDTGSAGTIFNVNKLEEIGVKPEANDVT